MSDDISPDLAGIDALLRRAAAGFAYPPTPPIANSVASRLAEPPAPRPTFGERARSWFAAPPLRFALAGLAALLFAMTVVLALPGSRTAVAELFGLRHVEVRVERAPSPSETAVDAGPARYAEPATLGEARSLAGFPVRLPTYPPGIGTPSAVYVQHLLYETVVILSYEEEGFELHQARLRGKFVKGVPRGIEVAAVGGALALWVPGEHGTAYEDENGMEVGGSVRPVYRPTLLWERDGITYRLETDLSKAEAIRVAESLR
jgi:hypothetical protein